MASPFDWLPVSRRHHAQLLAAIADLRTLVSHTGVQTMSALTDLQAAIARLSASTSAEIKAVSDKLSSLGDAVTSADVEAAVTSLNATADTLDAETASLTTPPAGG
jgi:hypothetical protein